MFRQNWTFDPSNQITDEAICHFLEVLEVIDELVSEGKIRHFGLSNESAWGAATWIKISEKHNIPFLGEVPLNSGIMEGSDLGKPVMMTDVKSVSADAFRSAAKNVAAQCSIVAAKLQEEMQSETQPEPTTN